MPKFLEVTDTSAARTALGATATGSALMTAEDAAGARTAVGASSIGSSVMTAASAGAARTAINADFYLNAADYGATGDGSTDDTTALQTWITAVVTDNAQGFLPKGTYKISSTLVVPPGYGWSLIGENVEYTRIVQHTDNVPVLQIGTTANFSHSWKISSFRLTYNSAQSVSNTSAINLLFEGTAISTSYNAVIENISFTNGYYAMKGVSGKFGVWGSKFLGLGCGNMSGGFYDNAGAIGGAPNCFWDRATIVCNNAVGPMFNEWKAYNVHVGTLEFLQAENSPQLIFSTMGFFSADIGAIKLEGATYTGNGKQLISFAKSSNVHIGSINVGGTTADFNPSSSVLSIVGHTGGGSGEMSIGSVNANASSLSGNVVVVNSAVDAKVVIGGVRLSDGWTLQYTGGTLAGNNTVVRDWVTRNLSDNKGDANYTITVGDPNVVHFNTAFTAQRTITLPSQSGNNMSAGLYYDLVFDGAINGANTAVIKQGAATIRTQTQDKKILHYMWRRAVWVLIGITDLNTGSTSADFTMGTIELGHASDTTISRASAGQLAVEGNPLGTKVAVPASAGATGVVGQWAAESGWLYICVAANTWERVAIASW